MQIRRYAISCSGDSTMNKSELYIFGGLELTKKARDCRHLICECRRKNKCHNCDAEIHEVIIERKQKTTKEVLSHGKF